MLINILLWLVFGGAAGWIASIIVGKDSRMGIPANVAIGVVGALIGGYLANLIGLGGVSGFNLWSLLIAVLGASLLLILLNLLRR